MFHSTVYSEDYISSQNIGNSSSIHTTSLYTKVNLSRKSKSHFAGSIAVRSHYPHKTGSQNLVRCSHCFLPFLHVGLSFLHKKLAHRDHGETEMTNENNFSFLNATVISQTHLSLKRKQRLHSFSVLQQQGGITSL